MMLDWAEMQRLRDLRNELVAKESGYLVDYQNAATERRKVDTQIWAHYEAMFREALERRS